MPAIICGHFRIFELLKTKDMNEVTEIFLPIKGYEGIYEISNLGRVKSLDRPVNTVLGKKKVSATRIIKGQIKKQFIDIGGYKVVSLSVKCKTVSRKVHCLVAQSFIPNPNHIDCNKQNNHVTNLEWCTASENMRHAYSNNLVRISKGENRHNSRFTNEQAKAIYSSPLSAEALSLEYNVHIRTIYSIKQGVNYSSITKGL